MTTTTPGRRNRLFGWSLFLLGIIGGMALGTFAFGGPLAAPERFAEYDGVPRRLIRLAHIAAMALGMTNVFYGLELDRFGSATRTLRLGSATMIAAGASMSVILTIAAFDTRWTMALAVPSLFAFVAVGILVTAMWRTPEAA